MSGRCWSEPGRSDNRRRWACAPAQLLQFASSSRLDSTRPQELQPPPARSCTTCIPARWLDGVHLAAFGLRLRPHRKEVRHGHGCCRGVRSAGAPGRSISAGPRAHHLPSPRSPSAVPRHRARPARRARGVGLVLLVDDSLDVREMYSQYLSYRGFSVITTAMGRKASRCARREA